jgi:CheY-like chemotaxis protein
MGDSCELSVAPRARILALGAGELLGTWLSDTLERFRLSVEIAQNADQALRTAVEDPPDLIMVIVADSAASRACGLSIVDTRRRYPLLGAIPLVVLMVDGACDHSEEHRKLERLADDLIVFDISLDVVDLVHRLGQFIHLGDDSAEQPASACMRNNRHCVLVVGDAPVFMTWIKDELERHTIGVEIVEDGSQAFSRAKRVSPAAIILVALCGDVPQMSGSTIGLQLKDDAALSAIPLICIASSVATAEGRERYNLIKQRSDAWLTPPIDVPSVLGVLDRWIGPAPVPCEPVPAHELDEDAPTQTFRSCPRSERGADPDGEDTIVRLDVNTIYAEFLGPNPALQRARRQLAIMQYEARERDRRLLA